jgi:hypothetical protein
MSVWVVTPKELADRAGVGGKAFRAWLRSEAKRGNPLAERHLKNERWEFTAEDGEELLRQFRERRSPVKSHAKEEGQTQPPSTSASLSVAVERVVRLLSTKASSAATLSDMPTSTGLYTLAANNTNAVAELGLEDFEGQDPLDSRILYLGKAEESLEERIASTHFKTGKTGHSTVRRTFAALLDLESCPRPSKIQHPSEPQIRRGLTNYGLIEEDDQKLTAWMEKNLDVRAAVSEWSPLEELERAAGAILKPPLDQERRALWAPNPWRAHVADRRAVLRERARSRLAT